MKNNINHTFAICAYGESPYLEECINSVLAQSLKSNIYISTATPNEYINSLAKKYKLPIHVNIGKTGMAEDFNFALDCAKTNYVTLAHQDDIYFNNYLEAMLPLAENDNSLIIAFSDYYEIKNKDFIKQNSLLFIKRIMNLPLMFLQRSVFVRNLILALGCSICCPSVMFNLEKIKGYRFNENYKCCLDWELWVKLAKEKGKFLYINKPLMAHRVHKESETTNHIENGIRHKEEKQIFELCYPKFIAGLICKIYKNGANFNNNY